MREELNGPGKTAMKAGDKASVGPQDDDLGDHIARHRMYRGRADGILTARSPNSPVRQEPQDPGEACDEGGRPELAGQGARGDRGHPRVHAAPDGRGEGSAAIAALNAEIGERTQGHGLQVCRAQGALSGTMDFAVLSAGEGRAPAEMNGPVVTIAVYSCRLRGDRRLPPRAQGVNAARLGSWRACSLYLRASPWRSSRWMRQACLCVYAGIWRSPPRSSDVGGRGARPDRFDVIGATT